MWGRRWLAMRSDHGCYQSLLLKCKDLGADCLRCFVIMGATSRSDNAPRASRACAGAKLACGSTHDHSARIRSGVVGLGIYVVEQFLNLRRRETICARANVCVVTAFSGRAACWCVRSQVQIRPKSRAQICSTGLLDRNCQ